MLNDDKITFSDMDCLRWDSDPANNFFSPHYFCAWRKAFLPMGNWQDRAILLSANYEKLFCNAVFGVQRFPGFSSLSLGGYYWPFRSFGLEGDLSDGGYIKVTESFFDLIGVREKWQVVRLGPVQFGDYSVDEFVRRFYERGWYCLEKKLGCTWSLKIPEDFTELEASWGKHLLNRVLYYTRRLDKIGTVSVRHFSNLSLQIWADLYKDCVAVEENSWVARSGGDVKFFGVNNGIFWESVLSNSSPNNIEISILYLDDRPISFSLTLDICRTRYVIANSYDDSFKDNSPGTILTYHVLKRAHAHKIDIIDWGLGDSGYKQRWGAIENTEILDRVLIRPGIRGCIFNYLMKKKGGFKESY